MRSPTTPALRVGAGGKGQYRTDYRRIIEQRERRIASDQAFDQSQFHVGGVLKRGRDDAPAFVQFSQDVAWRIMVDRHDALGNLRVVATDPFSPRPSAGRPTAYRVDARTDRYELGVNIALRGTDALDLGWSHFDSRASYGRQIRRRHFPRQLFVPLPLDPACLRCRCATPGPGW